MRRMILMSIAQGIMILSADYNLVVIEAEEVPLAASSGSEYFWLTVVVMVLVAAVALLAIYLIRCNGYRKRIRELNPGGKSDQGWVLRKLKESIAELEAKKVEENFEDNMEVAWKREGK